ncbi:hypothetical protein ACHAW5_003599 [Stephanodiscus triporus]|uniref:RING-type E3 ubiquitin transferase n=1 Tax=Stephanodiscus triporus TaxID=2934178 RepID=A0ABD3PCS6_9STRA
MMSPFLTLFAIAAAWSQTDATPAFVHRHRRQSSLLPSPHRCIIPSSLRATAPGRRGDDVRAPLEITFPTPEAAAAMGVRDWPQQFRASSWTEDVAEGGIATRYVLDGRGRLTVDYYDDEGKSRRVENRRVYPGTLVEVDGEAKLLWEVDDERAGMIVLTPNYEEGGKLLLVGGFLLVFCAGLLLGSGGI